jgi:hypothetical protein
MGFIKRQRDYLKDKSGKERLEFFWKYYKWHILIWTLGIICLFFFVYKKVTAPVYSMQGFFLNVNEESAKGKAEQLAKDFEKANNIDTSYGGVMLNDTYAYWPNNTGDNQETYQASEAILAQKEHDSLDFIAAPMTSIQDLAYNNLFTDLRAFLNQQQLLEYKDYLLYIDKAVITELEAAYENKEDVSKIELPDCTNPDAMKDPVPVMISISHCKKLAGMYDSADGVAALGIMEDPPHKTKILAFIDFIMK